MRIEVGNNYHPGCRPRSFRTGGSVQIWPLVDKNHSDQKGKSEVTTFAYCSQSLCSSPLYWTLDALVLGPVILGRTFPQGHYHFLLASIFRSRYPTSSLLRAKRGIRYSDCEGCRRFGAVT